MKNPEKEPVETVEGNRTEVVLDSTRAPKPRRRRPPSPRKMKAAELYASGQAKSVYGALVAANYSHYTAAAPSRNNLGHDELIAVELERTGLTKAQMYHSGLRTLHELAADPEQPPGVRGAAANSLVQRLQDVGAAEDASPEYSTWDRAWTVANEIDLAVHVAKIMLRAGRRGDRVLACLEARLKHLPEARPSYVRENLATRLSACLLEPATGTTNPAAALRKVRDGKVKFERPKVKAWSAVDGN